MPSYKLNHLTITLDKTGARRFTKVSYPIRYGRYAEIKTPDYVYQFNLNHEIKYVQGRGDRWPSPSEWLKRTIGNDWIYYLAGDYSGVRDAFGEFYLPCPAYATNTFIARNPFDDPNIAGALGAWQDFQASVSTQVQNGAPECLKRFLHKISKDDNQSLARKARQFHRIVNGPITVLPPDARHVDYEVIPIIIADGCLYKCGFCRVKTRDDFSPRSRRNIIDQIHQLKAFYGPNLINYNAVFLGLHDALLADPDLITFTAEKAYDLLHLGNSYLKGAHLFLFGSVDALIDCDLSLFDAFQALPYSTCINIGLESADAGTLNMLKKPIAPEMVQRAFARMVAINQRYSQIEITANFVYGDHLPDNHLRSIFDLVRRNMDRPNDKGTVYFSPLMNRGIVRSRDIVRSFYKIKTQIPLPSYLYLIQRL